ncbi:hypothetical protein WG922_11175 [Ramlibacter sp. AN1015]|uniref:hypothetical protein n=1 Tax=Ramlibacter sp. AN1015 TaxID=3133428 RepID=UPI0030BF0656
MKAIKTGLAVATLALIAACGGGGGDSSPSGTPGTTTTTTGGTTDTITDNTKTWPAMKAFRDGINNGEQWTMKLRGALTSSRVPVFAETTLFSSKAEAGANFNGLNTLGVDETIDVVVTIEGETASNKQETTIHFNPVSFSVIGNVATGNWCENTGDHSRTPLPESATAGMTGTVWEMQCWTSQAKVAKLNRSTRTYLTREAANGELDVDFITTTFDSSGKLVGWGRKTMTVTPDGVGRISKLTSTMLISGNMLTLSSD